MAKAATKEKAKAPEQPAQQAQSKGELILHEARMPYHSQIGDRFGIDKGSWKVLVEAIFPSAKTIDAVIMALSYCKHRNLDIFKKPVHIVPMWDSARGAMVETVWPSISELRTTASRTKQYAGCDEAVFGPTIKKTFTGKVYRNRQEVEISVELEFPEWCRMTVYKLVGNTRCAFVGPKVKWIETYATQGKSDVPNQMWQERPEGQHEKCAEAAALRRAFPEELGSEYAAEEMEGRRIVDIPTGDPNQPAAAVIVSASDRDAAPPRRGAQQEAEVEEGQFTEVGSEDPKQEDEKPPIKPPHTISATGMSFEQFAKAYMDTLKANCTEPKQVYDYGEKNKRHLDHLHKNARKLHDDVRKFTEELLKELRVAVGTATKNDPISTGTQTQEKAFDKDPPKDDGPPKRGAVAKTRPTTVTQDPEEILKQIKDRLAAIDDPNNLEDAWEACQELFEQLDFPADKEAARGYLKAAEKRLGID